MSFFCPLASGSKGNASLLKTEKGNILIDAGLSAKALSDRLQAVNASLESIKAIFITHEHQDHIAGLKSLAFKYSIPVIANYATAEAIVECLGDCPSFKIFTTDEPFEFLGMEIHPFSVRHDGVDPVGLSIKVEGKKLGICTDIGFVTHTVRHHLKGSNIVYIEANHQPEMVHASTRPDIYKRRVLSQTGHLSNEAAGKLLLDIMSPTLEHVFLAHLSSECNTPETALRVISGILGHERAAKIKLSVAYQDTLSEKALFTKFVEAG